MKVASHTEDWEILGSLAEFTRLTCVRVDAEALYGYTLTLPQFRLRWREGLKSKLLAPDGHFRAAGPSRISRLVVPDFKYVTILQNFWRIFEIAGKDWNTQQSVWPLEKGFVARLTQHHAILQTWNEPTRLLIRLAELCHGFESSHSRYWFRL